MKKPIEVGDIHTVEFLRNEKGGKPVCRINGVVGFITNDLQGFVAPRSVWQVSVTKVSEKSLDVLPLFKIKTAWENLRDIDLAISALKKEKKPRHKKPHVTYTNL